MHIPCSIIAVVVVLKIFLWICIYAYRAKHINTAQNSCRTIRGQRTLVGIIRTNPRVLGSQQYPQEAYSVSVAYYAFLYMGNTVFSTKKEDFNIYDKKKGISDGHETWGH